MKEIDYYNKKYSNLFIFILIIILVITSFTNIATAVPGDKGDVGGNQSNCVSGYFECNPNPAFVDEYIIFNPYLIINCADPVSIRQYYWDFGDGDISNIENPIHNYSSAGEYIVNLTVTYTIGRNIEIITIYFENLVTILPYFQEESPEPSPSNQHPVIISSSESFSVENGDDADVWVVTNEFVTSAVISFSYPCLTSGAPSTENMLENGNNNWSYTLSTDTCDSEYQIDYFITVYSEYEDFVTSDDFIIYVTDENDIPLDSDDDDSDDDDDDFIEPDDDDDNGGDDDDSNQDVTPQKKQVGLIEDIVDYIPVTSPQNGDTNVNDNQNSNQDTDDNSIQTNVGSIVKANEKVEFYLQKSEQTGFTKVSFTSKQDLENVEFKLEKLEEKPEEINEEPTQIYNGEGKVYSYLNVKLTADGTYISNELESMTFEFKVDKQWLTDNDFESEHIKFVRYHNDWQDLEVQFIQETDEYYTFTAETPGLSTFAVVGSKIVEKVEPEDPEPEIPWIFIIIFIVLAFVVLMVILIKARYIYIEKTK